MEPLTHPTRHERKCVAHRNSDGQPCERWAIEGGTVCPTHGGSVGRVKDAARRRVLELVAPALARLEEALDIPTEDEKQWTVVLRAVKEVLDRAGVDSPKQIEILQTLDDIDAALSLIEAEDDSDEG